MDDPRYRKQLRPTALNVRKRHLLAGLAMLRKHGVQALFAGFLILLVVLLAIRQPEPDTKPPEPAAIPPGLITRLAETRVETAMAKLDQGRTDEALALMVSALRTDSTAVDAHALAEKILLETTWHIPVLTIKHPLPIDRIEFVPPSSIWVGLAGEKRTIVRWNLETLHIESVLFPLPSTETRSLVLDPSHRRMIVERAGILLLCDAQSLKPISELGVLPDFVTPSSVITFSADGLLVAHPALVSGQDQPPVWQLRDAESGNLIRSSEPAAPDAPHPLAAFLDRRALHVLNADGSILEIPVSPADAIIHTPAAEKTALHHALFSTDGKSALVLIDHGPHRLPELKIIPADGHDDSLQAASMLERFAWNRHPGIWSGLLRDSRRAPLKVEGNRVDFLTGLHAPVHSSSPISAVAAGASLRLVGGEDGALVIHQLLPGPVLLDITSTGAEAAGQAAVSAFENLTAALAGLRHDQEKREFIPLSAGERLQCLDACDFDALGGLFPRLDFSGLSDARGTISPRLLETAALQPLRERLARADSNHPDADSSPAAKLAMALDSQWPAWIEESLAAADDLPPLLHKLADSRIAWLEGRKADALAGWPDVLPDLAQVRLREDWDGWEQADFGPALEKFRLCVIQELSSLELPENPTPAQVKALIERLMDPETFRSVGRARLAQAYLEAALVLSSIPGEAESALKLATLAGHLGAPTEPRLRAEALALSALGDYPKARDRWVLLLTEHPVDTHEPTDYTEAAYTAFEAADPGQAMEILTTGMHRFPNDVDFALRAGWIALLTGNPDRAYRFLLTGRQTGYPPAKLENATALLTIAAAQTGAIDDAVIFREQLIAINPAWQDPETIEALEWPEDLKSTLRQLTW